MDELAMAKSLLARAAAGAQELRALAGYVLVRELGRGGMGVVYLIQHPGTNDRMALKLMLPAAVLKPKSVELFMREIEVMKALNHRHIVQIRAGGSVDGLFFIALEFCVGGSVSDLMEERGGILSPKEAVDIILQILEGLEYAHSVELPAVRLPNGKFAAARGLVHRDVKPNNMLLHGIDDTRVAKLSDYGLAKAFDLTGHSKVTGSGVTAGTVAFMPRQQVRQFKHAKPPVDIWATAASLYFMLTGFPPRNFSHPNMMLYEVSSKDAVPILQRNSRIPRYLAEALDYSLVDRPNILVNTSADLRRRLEAARQADGF